MGDVCEEFLLQSTSTNVVAALLCKRYEPVSTSAQTRYDTEGALGVEAHVVFRENLMTGFVACDACFFLKKNNQMCRRLGGRIKYSWMETS